MPRKNKYDYVNLNDYENYDFYNPAEDNPIEFNPVEYQPGVYENITHNSDLDDYINNIGEPIPKLGKPENGFNWGAAGKYGLGALGVGGAIYGLYRLINYLRNRNKPATPTIPAPNPNVIQPPISPTLGNRFKRTNRFKNKNNKFKTRR